MKIEKIYVQTILYKVGDSIRVNKGVIDYISEMDIGGLEGRVFFVHEEMFNSSYDIELDSISLQQLSKEHIEKLVSDDSDFGYIEVKNDEISQAEPRDKPEDVKIMQKKMYSAFDFDPNIFDDDEVVYDDNDDNDNSKKCENISTTEPFTKKPSCGSCNKCSDGTPSPDNLMDFIKENAVDMFIFCDSDNQIYSIEFPISDLEKYFCPIPIKEWEHECKEFRLGYALN